MIPELVIQSRFRVLPASAVGGVVSTFTVTTSVALHPFAPVTVTVYVVVVLGLAVGCAIVVELSPVEGDQLYVLPTIAAVPIVVEVVVQFKSILLPASAVGGVVSTFTVTTSVALHPFAPVTVTV